jgi:putative glutamine amidotransferase
MAAPTGPIIAAAWLERDYRSSLERAGARVRVLTPTDPLPAALDGCAGLMLTGGVDVDPREYGDSATHASVVIDAVRDRYELDLAREALKRDLPVLAICRGAQVLNTAAGGTLIQDIPSAVPAAIGHQKKAPKDAVAHDVQVTRGTCLWTLLSPRLDARGSVPVNSRHHQSVKTIAPGFVVSAVAPDGVVEAIEKRDAAFCVGVQWHPENFSGGEFRSLFDGLVAAARLYEADE